MTFSNPIVGGTTLIRPAIQSPNYIPGSTGWTINKDGTSEFNNVTVRGTLQSNNYSAGIAGWKLDQAGSAEFNSVTIRGTGTTTPIIVGSSSNPQVTIASASNLGTINFPTNRPVEQFAGGLRAQSANIGLANEFEQLFLLGPTVTGATARCILSLNSQNNDGSSNANARMATGSSSVTFDQDVVTYTGNRVTVNPVSSANDALQVNALSGHTGNLANVLKNGVAKWTVNANGVMTAANRITGNVTITPVANTPTSAVITFPTALTGTSFTCQVSANTSVPGTQVTGVSFNNLSATGVTIWLTRTNTNSTTVSYTVEGF